MITKESVSEAIDDTSQDATPLALAVRLIQALNEEGISYCHWKSNWNLEGSLRGLSDLDLLVDRGHSSRFRELLCRHDFKPALSPFLREYPAMEDYLGYDRESGRLVQLHVHYQLILGERSVKNYRLPLEKAFLEANHTYAGVRIPSPELEIIVLTIRAILKYRVRQLMKGVLASRSRGLSAATLKEFEYLLNQTTAESISNVLGSQVALLSREVVLEALSTIKSKSQSGCALLRMQRRLRRELAPYQRTSRGQALARSLRAEWAARPRLLTERATPEKKTMAQGGLTIAVVGADGAGKSTVVRELSRWLSWRLTVHTYYMGWNQPSTLSRMAGLVSRIFGYAYRRTRAVTGEKNAISKLLYVPYSLFESFHRIGIARDSHARYVAGQRNASRGAITVYDRYPLEAVRIAARFMDGPQIASMHGNRMGPLAAALSRVEQNIFERIRPPDHLLVLQVSPGVAAQRKTDHKPEILEVKSQALNGMEREGLRVTEIDADQSLDRVLLEIKRQVWEML